MDTQDIRSHLQTRFAEIDLQRDPEEKRRRREAAREAAEKLRAKDRLPRLADDIALVRQNLLLAEHKLTDPRVDVSVRSNWLNWRSRDMDRLTDLYDEAVYLARIRPDLAEKFYALLAPPPGSVLEPGERVHITRAFKHGDLRLIYEDEERDAADKILIPMGATGRLVQIDYSYDPSERRTHWVRFDETWGGWQHWHVPASCLMRTAPATAYRVYVNPEAETDSDGTVVFFAVPTSSFMFGECRAAALYTPTARDAFPNTDETGGWAQARNLDILFRAYEWNMAKPWRGIP